MSATHSLPDTSGTKSLPAGALSLEQLKNQARSLLKSHRSRDPEAAARIRARHHRFGSLADEDLFAAPFTLADAQFVVAREQGFESWPRLKAHVEAAATLSPETIERFKEAVYAGDAVRVNRIIRQNLALRPHLGDPWFDFDSPAIQQAASQQNRRLIGVLLKAGADIDARSTWWAGSFGALDVADKRTAAYLIKHGAKVDINAAARHGMFDRVRKLVAENPQLVNARGGDGQTPLHVAKTVEICAFLLDHGAEIDIRDIDHVSTPAQYSLNRPDNVRYLISRGAEPDIFMACALGDKDIARAALEKEPGCLDFRVSSPPFSGAHIYIFTGLGPSARPLPIAVERGHTALCEFLLPYASPAARLIYACWAEDDALIRDLLTADPNLVADLDPVAQCAICDAAWVNRVEAVRRMIDAGFDIDHADSGPPLGGAACRGWIDLVRLLIERGANLETLNEYGGAPLGACAWGSVNWPKYSGGHAACTELLLAAGARPPKALWGSEEVREVLRRYGVREEGE